MKDILGGKDIHKGKDILSCAKALCVPLPRAAKLAISATASTRPWRRAIFRFARLIYTAAGGAQANLADGGPLCRLVRDWFQAAKPGVEFDETWAEFRRCYPKVRYPVGHDKWRRAVDDALDKLFSHNPNPGDDTTGWHYPENPSRSLLVALCWVLSQNRSREFFLSVRSALEACEFDSRMAAWRSLRRLEDDGFVEPVQAGTVRGRRATVYRFVGRY